MRAIISDIHSNLEALRAVLADIDQYGVEDIYCLGDVVGYGPDPRECLDLVMRRCKLVLLGNHDEALFTEPVLFTLTAERAIRWTRAQLEEPVPDQEAAGRRLAFLKDRPLRHQEGGLLYVHGSPCNPLSEYVFPAHTYDAEKMERLFAEVERGCFMGHTHCPGVFIDKGQDDQWHFRSPDEIDNCYRLCDRKFLCNVGSVGQPRDGDRRACFVLFDGTTVHFRRVEYDIDATVEKMRAVLPLAGSLSDRLLAGR